MTINVVDESHNYSLILRFRLNANNIKTHLWFDIVDDTEMDF